MRVARLTAVLKGAIRRTQSLARVSRRSSLPARRSALKLACTMGGSLLASTLLGGLNLALLGSPAWALVPISRPDLSQTRRAEVLQVLDVNRLAVRLEGEITVRVVELIGLGGIPPINPAWTEITRQTPMPLYLAGQYLQDTVGAGFVDLEFDPRIGTTGAPLQAYVWKANTFVNREMLLRGHATFIDPGVPTQYGSALQEAATVAERQGRGIWSFYGPRPVTPGSGSSTPGTPSAQPDLPFDTPLDAIGSVQGSAQ